MRYLSVSFVLFLTMFTLEQAWATPNNCNFVPDYDANLEHLLNWCKDHHKSDDECAELLDLASQHATKEFLKKLKRLEATETSVAPKIAVTNTTHSWTDIPKSPAMAIEKLDGLIQIPTDGINSTITLGSKAKKKFETLNNAEIKHAYEIIEKMKSATSIQELDKFLATKGREALIGSHHQNCSGSNVFSLRLSVSARMCYQITAKKPFSINILCMGHGTNCYNH